MANECRTCKIRRYIRETLPNINIEESVKYVLAEKIYMPPGMVTSANRWSRERQIPVSELTKSLYECSSLLRDHKQVKEAANMMAEKCFKVRCVMHDAHVRHQWDPEGKVDPDMGEMHFPPNTEVYGDLVGCLLNPLHNMWISSNPEHAGENDFIGCDGLPCAFKSVTAYRRGVQVWDYSHIESANIPFHPLPRWTQACARLSFLSSTMTELILCDDILFSVISSQRNVLVRHSVLAYSFAIQFLTCWMFTFQPNHQVFGIGENNTIRAKPCFAQDIWQTWCYWFCSVWQVCFLY